MNICQPFFHLDTTKIKVLQLTNYVVIKACCSIKHALHVQSDCRDSKLHWKHNCLQKKKERKKVGKRSRVIKVWNPARVVFNSSIIKVSLKCHPLFTSSIKCLTSMMWFLIKTLLGLQHFGGTQLDFSRVFHLKNTD